jgi:hypothetical protein
MVIGFTGSLKIAAQSGVRDGAQNFCDSGFTCCRHLTPFAAPLFIASFKFKEANGESSAINFAPCSSWYPVIGVPYFRVCFGAGVGPFFFSASFLFFFAVVFVVVVVLLLLLLWFASTSSSSRAAILPEKDARKELSSLFLAPSKEMYFRKQMREALFVVVVVLVVVVLVVVLA